MRLEGFAFQFLNGSIKRLADGMNQALVYQFQFLNGSIKSYKEIGTDNGYTDFNSSMVRLKGIMSPSASTLSNYFNSSMVRLKGRLRYFSPNHYIYFNSSMVRLKAALPQVHRVIKLSFQFLNGSIKSTNAYLL